ncbi:LacI family DNA-binding transcriptional regulator [Anditalea andensis]|uniref:LacI family transcriptional regulator n=1 Tax=Anditalea andensis TaxID=1048983 RepID=A0A074L214_9BACT|nr:LacI family DNA-binding transcriptional regulator [Anditalea andensis]KEO73913.1 LacI family transcriptional regulator [Anditalea andensis]
MAEITIKYLAEKLKMAPSTVSRALNDSYEISQPTKDKVLKLARELNYQPNPYARSLREHKSKTIAVIIPERINNFFSQVIDGIEDVTQQHGFHLLMYNTHEDIQLERKIISYLLNGRVDAIVMSVSSQTSEIDHLETVFSKGLPIIFFDRICPQIPTTQYITNDYESGFKATEHLITRGCSKILFLLLSKEISIGVERLRGYRDALKAHKIVFEDSWIVQCCHEEQDNVEKISMLLQSPQRADGILASVEKLAIATYRAVNKQKLSMPKDIKLVSFSNMKIADLLCPSLTTISQPAYEIGKECAIQLMKKLSRKTQPDLESVTKTFPSIINIRESSGG